MTVDRFTVSLDTELLAAFDAYIASSGYSNRSEAIRDLIRDQLVAEPAVDGDGSVIAVITFVSDSRIGRLHGQLRTVLAESEETLSPRTLYTPIDARHDHWAVAIRGASEHVQAFVHRVQGLRGVAHPRASSVPLSRLSCHPTGRAASFSSRGCPDSDGGER